VHGAQERSGGSDEGERYHTAHQGMRHLCTPALTLNEGEIRIDHGLKLNVTIADANCKHEFLLW
jgi:hypothetical protein